MAKNRTEANIIVHVDKSPGPPRGLPTLAAPAQVNFSPRNSLPIAGVVFDMGDVIYDATIWRRWLLRVLAQIGFRFDYCPFFAVWDRDYLERVHRGERDYDESLTDYLSAVGLSRAQIDEVLAASHACRRELEVQLRPLPGVRKTVASLDRSGISLAVLSDSEQSSGQLECRLRRMGLGDVFRTIVSSVEVGRTKPAAICYQSVLEGMGLSAAQTIFVGHDSEELAGATAVGMRTVAINYEPAAVAERYIERFEELFAVIEQWSPRARAG